jgi:hypothetical protein
MGSQALSSLCVSLCGFSPGEGASPSRASFGLFCLGTSQWGNIYGNTDLQDLGPGGLGR